MNNEPREKLREIIETYGREVCDELGRCRALLLDMASPYRREVRVILGALEARVPYALMETQPSVPRELVIARLVHTLQDDLSLSEEAAKWGVDAWAFALADTIDVGEGAPSVAPFLECFNRNGGEVQVGRPLGEAARRGPGWAQDYDGGAAERGSILLRDGATTAYWVHGPIWHKWIEECGGATGWLGYPVMWDELESHSSRSGSRCRIGYFENGMIVYFWEKGLACALYGPFLAKWIEAGGSSGYLGLPTNDVTHGVQPSSQGTAYKGAEFEHGFVCRHASGPRNGQTFVTNGGIYWKYKQMGGPQSVLGLPIHDEADGWPSGVSGHKCRYSLFENGVLHWHAEGPLVEQSFEMHGAIANKYNGLFTDGKQGSGSFLGLPVQDQFEGTRSQRGTRGEVISCEGGWICSHLDGPLAGQAFIIPGVITGKCLELSGSGGEMGWPVSDEYMWDMNRRLDFEQGYMLWREGEDISVICTKDSR